MSDDANETPAVTSDVNDGPLAALVTTPNGGALFTGGNVRPVNPTPNDVRNLCRKRLYEAVPKLNRIAKNEPPRKGAKERKDGPFKVADQLRAIDLLMRGAEDDTIRASDLRRALKGFSDDVRRQYPGATGEAILALAAPWFFSL